VNPLRRSAFWLRDRFSRDRGIELSAEDELFAERLTEMLRAYVEAEIPDSSIPEFRVPSQSTKSRRVRRVSRSSRRSAVRPLTRPRLEVSREEPH
jgi:hypothetical protein